MTAPQIAIALEEVSFRYGPAAAVDRISLEVGRGEVFGLVGPDGAGKTTLIRLLCGLLRPSAGTCRVAGCDTVEQRRGLKERIGYLSQRFSLYGDLTVEENIDFIAQIHSVRDFGPRKENLLQFTRLTQFRGRLAERLSGGMKQKLALACTLIHEPEVIFLDEPTTGVDPVSRRDFWKILNDLRVSGLTIFMATPYLDEAERCSKVALMDHGRILACASPRELRQSGGGSMAEVVCDRVREAAAAVKAGILPRAVSVQRFGDRIHVSFAETSPPLAELGVCLEATGVTVLGLRSITPSLEDVYIDMVSRRDA